MTREDFFSRWSDRKRKESRDEPKAQPDDKAPDKVEEAVPEEDEAALLERLGLPDPDTLNEGDNFAAFMEKGVPEFLRRRALRRLWRSNPVLANLDGLNDYDDDFTSPELTQKVLATAYQVGRGILRKAAEKDDPIEKAETAEPHEVGPAEAPHISDLGGDVKVVMADAGKDEPAPESDQPRRKPRRMTFRT